MFKKINIVIDGVKIKADSSLTILDNALKNNIKLNHSCGKMGTCGTCRVEIINSEGDDKNKDLSLILNQMNPKNEIELEFTSERGFSDRERLSCQTYPVEGLILTSSFKKA